MFRSITFLSPVRRCVGKITKPLPVQSGNISILTMSAADDLARNGFTIIRNALPKDVPLNEWADDVFVRRLRRFVRVLLLP